MKVTIVLGASTGGVGKHVRSLVNRLPSLGVEVTVAGPIETERNFGFSALGASFHPVVIASSPGPQGVLTPVRLLRGAVSGSHVVHAHGLRAAALTGLALGRRRPGRIPLVATWHNAVIGAGAKRAALAGLETLATRRADVTLGASFDLVQRARRLGARDARLGLVAAPVLPPPSRSREQVRAELGAAGRPLVLAIGRLAPQKDYDTLLAAAAALRQRQPVPRVAIAGDGPQRDRLQGVIESRGLDVLLLGHRNDVPNLLAAADVYVLTSRWEARALVLQEAMTVGVPVVATAVGGIPELVGDGGVQVRPRDADAVARAVACLLDDPTHHADIARRGRAKAATWPDEDAAAQQIADLYQELTSGHDTGRPRRW